MPADTALSRVTKSDFFAILGSGTYVVGTYGLLFISYLKPDNGRFGEMLGRFEKHWSLSVGFFFLAFLVGNALRALPVNAADKCSGRIRLKLFWLQEHLPAGKNLLMFLIGKNIGNIEIRLNKAGFPYREMLELEWDNLKKNLPGIKCSFPQAGTDQSMFKFWKMSLCLKGGQAFEFIQELEGRVRLFATMFWASFWSLFPSGIGVLVWWHKGDPKFCLGMVCIFVISMLICCIFGAQIRRVRSQEVVNVFFAYISLKIDESREKDDSDPEPPGK